MNVTGEKIPSADSENYEAATWFPGGRKFCSLRYLKPDRIRLNIKAPGSATDRGCVEEPELGRDTPHFPALFLVKYFFIKSHIQKACNIYLWHTCPSATAIKEITGVMNTELGAL